MTGVLVKRKGDTEQKRPSGDGGRDWSLLPEAKKCLGPLEAEAGEQGFFPRAFRGSVILLTP